ncbi:MAG: hypothetical protein BWY72_01411 [Bacteroidetes bacterium ADurb.Bin416]|nr:MAG: hypothetical protein BWY72_01411 [Bacteroidetes bacterium ADurb.Bin416]
MKRLKTTGHLLLMLVLVLTACGQGNQPEKGWNSLKAAGFSLDYPATWEMVSPPPTGMAALVVTPQTSEDDAFRDNVNVLIQSLEGTPIQHLDQYVALSVEQITTAFADSKLLTNERVTLQGQPAHHMVYTATQNRRLTQFDQYFLVKDAKVYVLTLTCEQSAVATFAKEGRRILTSFTFQ